MKRVIGFPLFIIGLIAGVVSIQSSHINYYLGWLIFIVAMISTSIGLDQIIDSRIDEAKKEILEHLDKKG